MSGYPKPRYVRLRRPKSVEELMPKARELVNQPPGHHQHALKPSYDIKPGDKVLFGVLSEYNPMVIEAMCRAMREKGAKVDVLTIDSTPVAPPKELAVHELLAWDSEEEDYDYFYTLITNLMRTSTAKAMVKFDKYTCLIAGEAGPVPIVPFPWHRFVFTSLEDFASDLIYYPAPLLKLTTDKLFAQIASCTTLRLTDPEGTDVKWTNYRAAERTYYVNHILARPNYPGYGFRGRNYGGNDDCVGVVAGTLNHMGAFPHIKAYIEGGQVVKVEGGGIYGEVWREKLEKYKNVLHPPCRLQWVEYGGDTSGVETFKMVDPGLFWFRECAIGCTPGMFKTENEGRFECYANHLHARVRSGYIHNGFGPQDRSQPECAKAGLPWAHVHIDCVFPTLEGTNAKGERVTIIDKGHLTALDDPEVRGLATKYGDPAELLREAWFPAIPGINVPGDYMKDYAQDPVSWIKREAEEHPIWID